MSSWSCVLHCDTLLGIAMKCQPFGPHRSSCWPASNTLHASNNTLHPESSSTLSPHQLSWQTDLLVVAGEHHPPDLTELLSLLGMKISWKQSLLMKMSQHALKPSLGFSLAMLLRASTRRSFARPWQNITLVLPSTTRPPTRIKLSSMTMKKPTLATLNQKSRSAVRQSRNFC